MTLKQSFKFIPLLFLGIIISSCTYEKIKPVSELPQDVSFKNDLIPLFNQSCNIVGCHSSGGIAPDLSEENAYHSLTTIADMIDLENPEKSEIYVRMIDTQNPMPMSGVLSYQSKQVLSWIKDGAKDN